MEVLYSKLRPPKRRLVLRRKRLTRLFDHIHEKKITLVTAGAGYGKTTLVMDALTGRDTDSAWYRLDEQDIDFSTFISYLYAAVSGLPEPGVGQHKPAGKMKRPEALLLEWLAFLEKNISRPAVLILDDFHLVRTGEQIRHAVEFILARLPGNIHFVIIGRQNPGLRLSGFRVQDQLTEINESDLSFTRSETRLFFRDYPRLTGTDIDTIQTNSGGWAASLVLLRYTLKKQFPDDPAGCLASFKRAPRYIFSYLKENIFDCQPDHIKDFMIKAALFSEIDTRRCREILETDHAETILNQMVEDHLMTFPADDSGHLFYFHHLFRDFLLDQLEKNLAPQAIQALHCSIAQDCASRDIFQALHHFIEGRAFDKTVELIEANEIKFLAEGKIIFLDQCLGKVPGPVLDKNPQLLLLLAKLCSFFGRPGQAIDYLNRAHRLFKKQALEKDMVKCLVELGSQYYFTGYVKEAKLLMEQVIDEVAPLSATYTIAMTFLTFLSSVLGEFKAAEKYDRATRETLDRLPEFERRASTALLDTSYTYTLYIRGEFEQSYRINKKLLKSVQALDIRPCLPLVFFQLSATSVYLEKFEAGIEYGEKGIKACEAISLQDSKKGWVYLAWAENCFGLGQHDRAIELIDASIELFEPPGNRWGLANAWECLHRVFLDQGKVNQAGKILEQALDIIAGFGLTLTEGILANSRATLLIREDRFTAARDCLDTARPKLDGARFHLFSNHLLTAEALAGTGNSNRALDHVSLALSISREKDYDRFIKKREKWLVPFLEKTSGLPGREHRAYLEKLFPNRLHPNVPRLNMSMLGRFELDIGGKTLPLSQWKSAKALMILKYLAARRHKGFIPREVIIEMLWPEQDLKQTAARFNTAMSALRKTLEPGLLPKAPSAYIERKKDSYRLFPDHRIRIDTERFSFHISRAAQLKSEPEKAMASYEKACTLYKGPFLEEDRYEEWCLSAREAFQADQVLALTGMAAFYQDRNAYDQAVHFTRKILEIDPWDEKAYQRLMVLYTESGRRDKLAATWADYQDAARKMACPANEKIKKLYHRLMKG